MVARIDDAWRSSRSMPFKAQIEGIRSERARLKAERTFSREPGGCGMKTRTSGVTVREKARQALKSDLDFAKLELDRTKTLFASEVVDERQLQTAQAAVTKLEIQLLQMEAEHEQAEGSLDEARAGERQAGA